VTTFTIRNRTDVLAAAPFAIGFQPHRSVVMMAIGPNTFHARIDAPDNQQDLDACVRALLDPAVRHGAHTVIFALYDLPWQPEHVAHTFRERFAEHLRVGDVVLATQTEYQAEDGTWVTYDTSTSALTAQAVVNGRVIHRSREELVAMLQPGLGTLAVIDRAANPADAAFMRSAVGALEVLSDTDLVRFVANLDDPELRDVVTSSLTRDRAQEQVDFWVDVLRRTPVAHRTAPAAELALAAWLAGNGALAWCALDAGGPSELAKLMTHILEDAVPPSRWDGFRHALEAS